MSSKKELEKQVQSLCESELNFNAYYSQIEEQILQKDKSLIQVIVTTATATLDSSAAAPISKFLIFLLVQKVIVKRSQEMVNEAHQSEPFLKAIEKIAKHDKNSKDPLRGKSLFPADPEVGQQLLILTLEFIAKMAKSFPADSQKKPTKFALLHSRLVDEGVTFPKEPYIFFEAKKKKGSKLNEETTQQASRTPDLGKSGKMNQSAILKIMEDIRQSVGVLIDFLNTNDEIDEDIERELVNQTQRFTKHSQTFQNAVEQESDLTEDLMNKIFQHIDFLGNFCSHSQEVIGEGFLKDSITKFKDWLFSTELPFQLSDEEAESIKKPKQGSERIESQKNERNPSDNFDFNQFQGQNQAHNNYEGQEDMFGNFSRSQANKNVNSNINQQQQAFGSDFDAFKFDNGDEEAKRLQQQQQSELDKQMKLQRQEQEEQNKERVRKLKEEEDRMKRNKEEEDRIKRQRDEDERIRQQREEEELVRKFREREEEEKRLSKLRETEDEKNRKQREAEEKRISELNSKKKQSEEDERRRQKMLQDQQEAENMRLLLLKEQEEADKRAEEEEERKKVHNLLNQGSGFYDKERFSFNGFGEQNQQIPENQGYFYNSREPASPKNDSRQPQVSQKIPKGSKLRKIEEAFGESPQQKFSFGNDGGRDDKRKAGSQFLQPPEEDARTEMSFNEQFSVSNISAIDRNIPGYDFPMKLIKLMDNKIYKGEEVAPSNLIEKSLQINNYDAPNQRRFKRANLKRKNIIFENDMIQIGCVSDLIFDYINQQNYLKLNIFIGNKTRKPFRNVNISFDGDNSGYVYQKGDKSIDFITAKTQEKMEVIVGHKEVPFSLVSLDFSADLGEIEDCEQVQITAFLPHLLPKYFQFKDLDVFVFKQTWKQLGNLIQRTDIFTLSSHIVKSPAYFKRFFSKILELTPLDAFVSQNQNSNYDFKYYKLGALIELCDSESEFLLKFNVRPDNTLCIQIIAVNQAYRQTAAALLQHLRYLLKS